MIDHARLDTKLAFLEALYAGAGTPGERAAAGSALERLRARRATMEHIDPPVEYRFTFQDLWSRKLFVALLRRYELQPYRYYRQRYTTVMVKVTCSFVDDILWPEYVELQKELVAQLDTLAEEIIAGTIFRDTTDIQEIPGLPANGEA
jgi:hypothetical protein